MPSLLQRLTNLLSNPAQDISVAKTETHPWSAASSTPAAAVTANKSTFVFTPAKAAFCLFVGLTLWLFVLYNIRHNTPSASGHLPNEAVMRPVAVANGHPAALPSFSNAFPPTHQSGAGAMYAAETINTAGFATQPITAASPAFPVVQPTYNAYRPNAAPQRQRILIDR